MSIIKIEYNLPIEVAKIAKSNSINNFIYISSLGANPNAASLYLKNKGQTEISLIIHNKNKKIYYNLQNARKFDFDHLKAIKSKEYVKKITV